MTSLRIRDCEPGDVAAIQGIYAHYVRHSPVTFEEEVPDVDEIRARRQATLDAGYPYLVAETDGEVLGYAYAGRYRPRSAYRYSVEDSVYVRDDAKRRGVGRALLAELVARCRALGFKRMVAIIGDRSPPSVALHLALGFTLVGHLTAVGYKFGKWYDSTLLELDLSGEG